ncbi:unnamed protein product [Paramecium sonneborni]|uniref:Uncharacterized protein n=1 Tax=Paramecium sonneborni TaxID=65129 RepID=A0A8S1RQP2_9CILI|nr:unnamed protein product [Paramecium sonneborni]
MILKFGNDEQLKDLVWQKDQNIGTVITIHNVYIIDNSLNTLKLISLQPQVNKKNQILFTYWMAQALILQTKFHIFYVLLSGTCASTQSIDNYEEKNVLSALLWDRMVLLWQRNQMKEKILLIYIKLSNVDFQTNYHTNKDSKNFSNKKIRETSLQIKIIIYIQKVFWPMFRKKIQFT